MNANHHDRGDSGLGGPLIWTITALLALTAIALIISILPERIHEPPGLSEEANPPASHDAAEATDPRNSHSAAAQAALTRIGALS